MKIRRLLIAFGILAALGASAFSCTHGSFHDEKEPPCKNEIVIGDYDGPQHMIMGLGFGGLAALDIALDNPEYFATAASLGAPIDLEILLAQIEKQLADFDNIPDPPGRKAYLGFLRDLFIALGNPCYNNAQSKIYPPGTTGTGQEVVPHFVDRLNPGSEFPAITFTDPSGFVVDFLLALDLDKDSEYDPGEPIICQMHEPFTDQNGTGIFAEGDPFEDVGIDGVSGTGDFGEGNGVFDLNPNVDNWLDHDPARRIGLGEINTNSRLRGALYFDSDRDDYWGFASHADSAADKIDSVYAGVEPPAPFHCIEFGTARFDDFLGNFPFPTEPIWFGEKNVRLFWGPESEREDDHLGSDETQIARWTQFLSFQSARVPNGYFGDDSKDSPTHFEEHTFASPVLGEDITVPYAVFLPAGYYDLRSRWKTYPLLLVLMDKGQKFDDLKHLAEAQAQLAAKGFAQQVVMVMLPGERTPLDQGGYSFFMDQAASEFQGNYREMIMTDLIDHLQSRYRIKTRSPNG